MDAERQDQSWTLNRYLNLQEAEARRPKSWVVSAKVFLVVVAFAEAHEDVCEEAMFEWNCGIGQ